MPVRLRHIEIEKFRGICSLHLDLGDTTVLIGENNTGKTTVLDALRFALRDIRYRRGCAFDPYDFHLSCAKCEPSSAAPISIRLTFREDAPGEWDDQQLARLDRAKIAQVDANGRACVILKVGAWFDPVAQDFVHGWEFQNLTGAVLTNVPDTAIMTLQNEVSYHYLAALRDAARHFDSKGPYWRSFLKESQLTPEKRAEIEGKLADVNDLVVSSHASFSQVVARLQDLNSVISMTGGEDLVSIDAVPGRLFDMLAKAQVSLNACTGAKVPVGRHGEGTQSLAVLTLFNAFLRAWNKGDPIVALEEPEAHLHPSAVRALWQLIDLIPGQKIISTHSGDLLSEVPQESIVRLSRQSDCTVATSIRGILLDSKRQRQFDYHIRRTRGELLFARCWVLGEGETEVTLLPELARHLGRSLERNGIRCVDYRQSDISLFVQVAERMGIRWIALTDNDARQGKADQNKVRNALGLRPEARVLFVMPEDDIEQHLCAAGFAHVYEGFLTHQTQAQVTVPKTDPTYFRQLTKAVADHKIAAVHQVLDEIKEGAPVPKLLEKVIDAAIGWAEGTWTTN